MCSDRLRNRLVAMNSILLELDRQRAQRGNPDVGWGIEKRILDHEMADLERAMSMQEAMPRIHPQIVSGAD